MEAKKTEATASPAVNPFEGQGGSFYINPAGSNTLKRDLNEPVPFEALSKLEKHARLVAIAKEHISDRDRAARIGSLGLTADDHKQIKATPAATAAPAAPVAQAAPVTEPEAASVTKTKGAK